MSKEEIYGLGEYLKATGWENSDKVVQEFLNIKQENKELKEQLKIKNDGFLASIDETCEYATILTEYEKKLKKEIVLYNKLFDEYSDEYYDDKLKLKVTTIINCLEFCLNELRKLEESDK